MNYDRALKANKEIELIKEYESSFNCQYNKGNYREDDSKYRKKK
ncbi:hypothetical protein BCAH1134_C0172 (plasmid) [Bacillus cereus AH1134]|nr:hypothetical protein BCAH1134_C0172 [Bacillus cereus AH1134]